MLGAIILGAFGVVFLVVGYLIWVKQKISLLHSYHYNHLSPENKKKFCMLSGLGIIAIGLGLSVTAVIIGITDSALSFVAFVVGFVIGVALLMYAGKKYNLPHGR